MMALVHRLSLLALPSVAFCLLVPSSPMEDDIKTEADDNRSWPMELSGRITDRMSMASVMTDDEGKPITADYFMRRALKRMAKDVECLPELGGDRFAKPTNGMSRQLNRSSRVFFVGDSVIGQICQLGAPGLCCSAARPCKGPAPFPGSPHSPQERQLDIEPQYAGKDWQHLFEFKLRDENDYATNTAYFVAPGVHDEPDTVDASVKLVTDFLAEKGATREDVMVLGAIGTHYNHGLGVFQSFVVGLMQKVVNKFPGRVVLLGYSPQHFAGAGHYSAGEKKCAPNPLPSDVDMPRNTFRSAIFLYSVWAHLAHHKTRLVDFNEMLAPLWSCHRQAGDCTHWNDPVVSLQAQLILDALQMIE